MKTFVLYTKATRKTGKQIAKAMGADHGRKVPDKPTEYQRLVRWGASHASYMDQDIPLVINQAKHILHVSNRHHMMQVMSRSDVQMPYYGNGVSTLPNSDYCVLRTRFGRWGNDIIMISRDGLMSMPIQRHEALISQGYFSIGRWLADFEVRVHIVSGVSVCMQIKRHVDEATNVPDRRWVIRNRKNGWRLHQLSSGEATRLGIDKGILRSCAKTVIVAANLQFGVVDFLVRTSLEEDGNMAYKALEINTAPGLEDVTLKAYITRIMNISATVPSLVEVYPTPADYSPPEQRVDDTDSPDFDFDATF